MFHIHNLLIAYSLTKIQKENLALSKKPNKWTTPYSLDPRLLKPPNQLSDQRDRWLTWGGIDLGCYKSFKFGFQFKKE